MKPLVVLALAAIAAVAACDSDEPTAAEDPAEELGGRTSSTTTEPVAPGTTAAPVSSTRLTETTTASSAEQAALTDSPGSSAGEPQVDLPVETVRLWVSNQSFEDDPVEIRIEIDGEVVVDRAFAVESQHNWIAFDITGLSTGMHSLIAESDTGARIDDSFTLPERESRSLVIDYWYYPDDAQGRFFTFSESDEPVAFD